MEHVLVVEDDPALGQCLRQALSSAGYRVALATSTAEARKRFEPGRFALAVLDLRLPDGEGLALCREFRGQSSLPLIVASARGNGADRMLALESGADMYLAKPFPLP